MKQQNYSRTIKVSKVLLLVVFSWSLVSCEYLKQKFRHVEPQKEIVREVAKPDSLKKEVPRNIVKDSVRKVIAKKKAFEKALTDSLLSMGQEIDAGSKADSQYHIIAGSFADMEHAKEAAVIYSGKGYKSTLLRSSGTSGKYLVSVRSFAQYDKAAEYLKEFRTKVSPGAWIYNSRE
jgi:hypothetical protein